MLNIHALMTSVESYIGQSALSFIIDTAYTEHHSGNSVASSVYVGQVMRKCVLCYMRTTKVQISLRIHAVWSAPLLFAA